MQRLTNPVPLFLDARGNLLDGGNITLGVANADPASNPITAYWDAALTQVAAQPLRTLGGRIVNGITPATVFIAEDDFSIRIADSDGVQVDYSPTLYISGIAYQPLDTDLTAIATLATTSFGRNLLTLANQAALQNAVGITPFTGGTVTTSIVRKSAGVYPYWNDPAMTGGRIFITAAGAADPTSQPGDVWFQD